MHSNMRWMMRRNNRFHFFSDWYLYVHMWEDFDELALELHHFNAAIISSFIVLRSIKRRRKKKYENWIENNNTSIECTRVEDSMLIASLRKFINIHVNTITCNCLSHKQLNLLREAKKKNQTQFENHQIWWSKFCKDFEAIVSCDLWLS